jgi:hypothetical protein
MIIYGIAGSSEEGSAPKSAEIPKRIAISRPKNTEDLAINGSNPVERR